MKTPISIEVVRSNTIKLSSLSARSAQAIVASLSKQYASVTLTAIDTAEDLAALIERKPDLVFLGMKYVKSSIDPTKRIWLSEQLKHASIAFTGSTRAAHKLEFHKDKAKQQIIDHGLATARFYVAPKGEPHPTNYSQLNFPLFVKPLCGGGGFGIDEFSVVHTAEQLQHKISMLHNEHNADALIEEYLEGREFSVAIIKSRSLGKLVAMPLELIAPKDRNGNAMLSNQVKLLDQEAAIAVSDPKEHQQIASFALDVFHALGARDYGRIDIRLDRKGQPHFLEANLIPSLIKGYGSFPKAYKLNRGVDYDEMINNIVQLGLSRAATLAHQ